MLRKYFSCLTLVFLVLVLSSESWSQQQFSIASSSIGSSSGVASGGSFSASYSLGIPAAGEVSSNTFWTSAGLGPIASVLRCPVWWICGISFYDANRDGIRDSSECGIPGRLITIMGPTDTIRLTTDATGAFCHTCISPGIYTVCQALPESTATCKWITSTLCKTKNVTEPWRVNLGSAYSCIDERSVGYWSNKHGAALITDADLSILRTLNLRNADGSNFAPTTTSQYQQWLTSAGAKNMAYKLSEHLSALKLNLAHGLTAPAGNVDAGRNLAGMMEYANCLLSNPIDACGGSFAGQNGSITTGASALRAEQERLKNIIEGINSKGLFVQPAPCTVPPPIAGLHQQGDDEVNVEDVASSPQAMPTEFALFHNFPNPFNPTTRIQYALPVDENVTLRVYNTLGQVVRTLVDGMQTAGYKSIEFDARGLASGMYYYRLVAGNFASVQKMLLLR